MALPLSIMDIQQAQAWGILIASIVGAFGGLAAAVVSVIVAWRQGRTEKKVDEVAVKADGALSGLQKELQISKDRGVQLEDAIRESGAEVPGKTKQTAEIPNPSPVHVEAPNE